MALSGEFCPELLGRKPTAYALRSSVGENLRKTFLSISIGPSRISTPTHGLANIESQILLHNTQGLKYKLNPWQNTTAFICILKVEQQRFPSIEIATEKNTEIEIAGRVVKIQESGMEKEEYMFLHWRFLTNHVGLCPQNFHS